MIQERNTVSPQACKSLKKKQNPLPSTSVITKSNLQALIVTGQTLGGAVYKTM